jgi:hypothetical protein
MAVLATEKLASWSIKVVAPVRSLCPSGPIAYGSCWNPIQMQFCTVDSMSLVESAATNPQSPKKPMQFAWAEAKKGG